MASHLPSGPHGSSQEITHPMLHAHPLVLVVRPLPAQSVTAAANRTNTAASGAGIGGSVSSSVASIPVNSSSIPASGARVGSVPHSIPTESKSSGPADARVNNIVRGILIMTEQGPVMLLHVCRGH